MKQIYYDELTGCYNRRYLHYWVDDEIKRANRFATKFALVLLDIDDFRNINNDFGHLEGDRVLIEFTSFLRKNIREVDNLVRYGGDEFIILMPNTDEKGAMELAQRILNNINNMEIASHKILCSIGFSIFPKDGTTTEILINQADNLMYQAKKQGKNRIGLKKEVIKKLQIPALVTIGRDDEVNWCLEQLKNYNTIFITGEAGIGKTRLALEIKDRLRSLTLLRGNAYAALSSVPYHPFRNMFNELINKDFNLVQSVFKQIPEIYKSEIMKILPSESVLQITRIESLDKYRLYNAVSEFMNTIADIFSPNTTIFLLDDLHWLGRASCELLDFLIRSIGNRIKIFGTYRIEEIKNSQIADFLGIWAREKLYTQITLSPLNEVQSTQLLKAVMGSAPYSAIKYIFHQSGGNPFYIEEILRELERQKKLYWNGREWNFAGSLEMTIPNSIEETIKRKLKFLDPEIKSYLEIGAVYGQEFTADIIAMASKRNVGQILDALDELQRRGFIKERSRDNYFFSEDIVRQIVYKNVLKSDLINYHQAVGETIESIYRNVIPNYFEQLATHFNIANEPHKALYYTKKAALKAKDNYAHLVAIRFYENALRYEDNIEEIFKIKFSLAEIYLLTGNYKKALQHLDICQKIDPNSYKTYEKLGKVYESMGDYKNSLRYYQAGLKTTQGTDAVYTFRTAIAWLNTLLGQYLRAQKECEDILKKKPPVSNQILGDTYTILGVVLLRRGEFNKADVYFKKSLRIRESIGDKKRIAACYLDLAINYQERFNIKMSERFNNRALRIFEEIGCQEGILLALNNLGTLYANYDLLKAEEYYLRALKQAKLIGAKRTIVFLYNNLGTIEYNRLTNDQALLDYKKALQFAKEINFHEGIIFSNLSLSEFYREQGKIKNGKSHLDRALRVAKNLNIKYHNINCSMDEIEYLLLQGNLKKANALLKKISLQLKTEHNIGHKIYRLIYQAKILVELKKYSRVHSYYIRAYKYVKALSKNRISGEIFYLRGVVYKKEGKFKESLKMFLAANQIFKTIGNLRYLDKIEREITETRI